MNQSQTVLASKTAIMFSGKKQYYIFYAEDSAVVKVKYPGEPLKVGTYYPTTNHWECERSCILRPDVRSEVERHYC